MKNSSSSFLLLVFLCDDCSEKYIAGKLLNPNAVAASYIYLSSTYVCNKSCGKKFCFFCHAPGKNATNLNKNADPDCFLLYVS